MAFAPIDVILNLFTKEEVLAVLTKLSDRKNIWLMIHEQYFYSDYKKYQPDFEEKLRISFGYLKEKGYVSCFFEDLI